MFIYFISVLKNEFYHLWLQNSPHQPGMEKKKHCPCVPALFSTVAVVLVLFTPGIEMEIVNSCEKNNGGCSHHCEHTTNGPLCSCNHGYQLDQDGKTCVGKNFSLWFVLLPSLFTYDFLFLHFNFFCIFTQFLTPCFCLSVHQLKLPLYHCVP